MATKTKYGKLIGKKVWILWVDSAHSTGWRSSKEIKEFAKRDEVCESVGFFVGESKENIVLAIMKGSFGDWSLFNKLPKSSIKKIIILKEK